MKIITLTLNPAFDVHCVTDEFRVGHESFFKIISKDAGGKGINISAALNSFGVQNTAVAVIGRENGDEYIRLLKDKGIEPKTVWVDGRIRENYILKDSHGVETRVSFNGFNVNNTLFSCVEQAVGETDQDTIITLTGSNPIGINADEVKEFVKRIKARGTKVVIDNRSFTLKDLTELKPYLIKPNKDEAELQSGTKIVDRADAMRVAVEFHERGIENVIITLGREGAVFACDQGTFSVVPPEVPVVSTIGAGDSTIAGFLVGNFMGEDKFSAFKRAVATGSAACCENGTNPPRAEVVERILKSY